MNIYRSENILSTIDSTYNNGCLTIAACTFTMNMQNRIEIVRMGDSTSVLQLQIGYPATSIKFSPSDKGFVASTSDGLRVYKYADEISCVAHLNNTKRNSPSENSPLTNMDWSTVDAASIVTSSLDTTCMIWDIHKGCPKTQLIAHDKEVYDVKFLNGSATEFVTCSKDGSIRIFDARSLEHSTILHESTSPILRIAPSPSSSTYISSFSNNNLLIHDLRTPGQIVESLECGSEITGMSWSDERSLFIGLNDGRILLKKAFEGSWVAHELGTPVNDLNVCRNGEGYTLTFTSGYDLAMVRY